jgi:[protein-PII] uridylyltransferase
VNAPDVQAALGLGQRAGEVSVAARTYLAEAREFLRARHAAGESGRNVNRAHSDLIDGLVRRLFELSEAQYLNEGGDGPSEFCVVAVGGYARREMSIHSDVDLLCLYRDHVTPYVKAVAERLQTWLWDAQVTLGGAVRTLNDTISLARGDATVATSLLAPRFLAGSGMLFHQFTRMVQDRLLDRPEAFIKGLIEATGARHTRYGDSLYLLQPNVKDGAGGLRDYHAAWWAMQAALPGTRNRSDLLHQGLLTHQEMSGMVDALDFLWRVRNELHLFVGRKHDQMSFDLQEHIAQAFGYEGEGSEGLPVEGLMRDYYRHARNVLNSSSLVMEQCLARVAKPRRRRVRDVEDGLRVTDGQLEIPHALQLRRDPLLLLRAFAVAQRHDVPLTRKARRLIRENLDLIGDAYRRDPAAVAIFFDILRAERRVTRTLLAMNEVGLLARFLPEWDHIVNRWQHVMYHTYTVDVHSIFLVEEVRRLWKGDFEKELPALTQLVRDEEDLVPLILGCLMHDIGKGFGGDHSPKGAVLARTCLERIGASEELIDTVEFLVREHLVMSHIAQRRDLSDPRLVLEFARTVGSRSRLRLLYLLTVVDIRASSKKAWTEWKGSLLQELFEKTSELLETGADDMERAMELFERRVETRRATATEELRKEGVDEGLVEQYFDLIPQRYFISHTPTQIARHARVATEHRGDRLFTHGIREMRGEFTEFILYTRDAHGLYSNVAGVLSAHNMNILGAHVYTTRDGMALEVYRVTTPPGDEPARELAWQEFLASLARVLSGEISVAELLRRRGRPISLAPPSPRQPEAVDISNEESDFYTIVDVLANDRIGLLHDLTRTIAEHGYEVYISKAGKVLDQISDTFYLKDAEGRKISDEGAIDALRRDLLAAIRSGDVRGAAAG